MQQLDRMGYDHATAGKSPEPKLAYEPDYLDGYRQGLIAKIKWAEEDLSCFEAEYDFGYQPLEEAE